MKSIHRQAIVPFSSEQMFALVNAIEDYPEFLPYCSGSKILEKIEHEVTAVLYVAKGGFEQSFTTKNSNTPHSEIVMSLVDGPFKFLNGVWTFSALSEQASKIELQLEFEFSNKLLELAFGKVFNQLVESFVDAFTARAKLVYA
ncbi:type II toxin-antitoxin system RatA family toxin [Kangiella sp. HZ709]|uniref:type II toxin-antitoxin system RatA family toxin n=1 Tax=Kangiella sp. HZ709 TaxID=2666328 RepID=UPI0012AFF6A9|nr:type II toxin-antitoxin system RatA family toxin [Kangiella sp. HZ709]MRX28544.1 ubiquinone-binding protein [Kangiella sp. HZ709]